MTYVRTLSEIDPTGVADVGAKAAHLAALTRLDGVRVPDGFCVTTAAYRRFVAGVADGGWESAEIPDEVAAAITRALSASGEHHAYAVRSSATAEDLPDASFAGQFDSYLDIRGADAVLAHVRRCWASLFTERAVSYRQRAGYGDRSVEMAVLVQRMVPADASGVLFTADPVTSRRGVVAIEAVRGLGEALVSGHAEADACTVLDGVVTRLAPQDPPVLTDAQALDLAALGRRLEAHFGSPQDVEWCLAGGEPWVVQSRPITTLFPIPDSANEGPHVYISVGHQQMMTDAMTQLGLSVWQLTTPRPMAEAGSRLFVDVAPILASAAGRETLLGLARHDPLIGDALRAVLDRGLVAVDETDAPAPAAAEQPPLETDPAIVADLIARNESSVARLQHEIRGRSGPELFDFIREDLGELKRLLFDPLSHQVIMAGFEAAWWLNEHLEEWLGERNAADVLSRSVPHNVTAEMGLALLELADAVRPHVEVIAFLEGVGDRPDDAFLDELAALPGGAGVQQRFRAFLDRYGARCAGEIDITRPRWSEQPAALVPTLLGNVRGFAPGEAARLVERGRRDAAAATRSILERLRAQPDGSRREAETAAMIERLRTFAGYREYPKFGMIRRYAEYRRALLAEADRLVAAGVLDTREDAVHLRFEELHEAARTQHADRELIHARRQAYRSHLGLTPPRVFTGDGEVITGRYGHDLLPPGALPGLAVSTGVVEGRARVVRDMAEATLEPGDILVTPYTDPSWTPLFVAAAGLVTEVGGQMTHGAVIAREYGLPAVVGVVGATRLISDGQRIRVHGTDGFVQPLE